MFSGKSGVVIVGSSGMGMVSTPVLAIARMRGVGTASAGDKMLVVWEQCV